MIQKVMSFLRFSLNFKINARERERAMNSDEDIENLLKVKMSRSEILG